MDYCPECGSEKVSTKKKEASPIKGTISAANYPQTWLKCSECGFVGAWDIEFGWKSNFPGNPF